MKQGEAKFIRKALRAAKAAGFVPVSVYDGGEHQRGKSRVMLESEVIDACASVDDSVIRFERPQAEGKSIKAWARVILGNDPDGSEVIADNSIVPGFAEAMDKILEEI